MKNELNPAQVKLKRVAAAVLHSRVQELIGICISLLSQGILRSFWCFVFPFQVFDTGANCAESLSARLNLSSVYSTVNHYSFALGCIWLDELGSWVLNGTHRASVS